MVTFGPTSVPRPKNVKLPKFSEISTFYVKVWFLVELMIFSENHENHENDPLNLVKTLCYSNIFTPGRKCNFLEKIQLFRENNENLWKYQNSAKICDFLKFCKKWRIMQHLQGPIFSGKWWNSSISLKMVSFTKIH